MLQEQRWNVLGWSVRLDIQLQLSHAVFSIFVTCRSIVEAIHEFVVPIIVRHLIINQWRMNGNPGARKLEVDLERRLWKSWHAPGEHRTYF